MILHQKLKYLRKRMGLSQLELAEKMQVSRQAVSGWEAGTSRPSIENVKSLGALYEVPLEYLLHDDVPELVDLNGNDGGENRRSILANIKRRNIILVLICIGLILALLCTVVFVNGRGQVVPMDNIKGSEVEPGEDFEFEIEW